MKNQDVINVDDPEVIEVEDQEVINLTGEEETDRGKRNKDEG